MSELFTFHISIYGRWIQICRAKLSYINSSDMQMYWHILHMWKHLRSTHIYLNILNMLKNSSYICVCILYPPSAIPNSLTREEDFVDQNCKQPCQTIPHSFTQLAYYDKKPLFFRVPTPQFQLLSRCILAHFSHHFENLQCCPPPQHPLWDRVIWFWRPDRRYRQWA